MYMSMPLAELFGITWLYWWQLVLIVLLVGLIIFWKKYREKQM